MRLLHCYVENFGKLRKFSYTFRQGLNVIRGENGWGKSTLAVFIKAMLYGLPATRSTDLLENERKRYAPWNGELFGGSLSFETEGRRYRIERVFGKRESDDVFKLFSIDTGLPSDDFGPDIGVKLFGIDEAGYERSTYFSQRPLSEKSGYGSIQSRLSEQEDLTLSERAFRLLDKRRKYYQMTGNRGKIAELDLAIAEQSRLLSEAERDEARLEEARRTCLERRAVIERTEDERKRLTERAELALAEKQRRLVSESYARLSASCERAAAKRDAAAAEIGETIPEEETIEKMLASSREIDRQLASDTELAEKQKQKKHRRRRILLGAIGVSALLVLVALLIPFYPLLVVGAVGLILFAGALLPKKSESDADGARRALKERIEQRRAFLAPLTKIAEDPALQDDTARLTVLRERRLALSDALGELARAEQELREFLGEHPDAATISDGDRQTGDDPSALRVEANRLYLELDRMRGELLESEHNERLLSDAVERIPSHRAMLTRLQTERATAAKHLAAILRTAEILEAARGSLITRYRDVVEASFRRYVTALEAAQGSPLSQDASAYTVSGELDVAIVQGGVTRTPAVYSTGYRDLFALCLRFAVTDALFTEQSAPMILDDPFVNLDDAKLATALALLAKLSEERQILYFTCASSRAPEQATE